MCSHPETRSRMLPSQQREVQVNRPSTAAPALLSPFSRILLHEKEPECCDILWGACHWTEAMSFLTLVMEGKEERGWSRCEGESGDRRALWVHQQETLPFLASVERQGHGPCLSRFPLISWQICKLVSSHRSSDILGALQRIILKHTIRLLRDWSVSRQQLSLWECGSLSWNHCGDRRSWRGTCLPVNRAVCVWSMRPAGPLGAVFICLVTAATKAASNRTPRLMPWLLEALGFCIFQSKVLENGGEKSRYTKRLIWER